MCDIDPRPRAITASLCNVERPVRFLKREILTRR